MHRRDGVCCGGEPGALFSAKAFETEMEERRTTRVRKMSASPISSTSLPAWQSFLATMDPMEELGPSLRRRLEADLREHLPAGGAAAAVRAGVRDGNESYLKLWLALADATAVEETDGPAKVLAMYEELHASCVFCQHPLFFEAWAWLAEHCGADGGFVDSIRLDESAARQQQQQQQHQAAQQKTTIDGAQPDAPLGHTSQPESSLNLSDKKHGEEEKEE